MSKTDGLVRPKPLTWKHRLGAFLVYWLIRMLTCSVRLRVDLPKSLTRIPIDQPVIFCIWHNRLSLALHLYRYYTTHQRRRYHLAAMVSASRDGGLLANVLERFNVQPVRGSSSRRGPQALLELTTWGKQSFDLAITPDGPRGPRYQIQTGIVSLAQITQLPIIPVSYALNWRWRLGSWDGFLVPLPFSKCVVEVGDPMTIRRDADEAEREAFRETLEKEMKRITRD